MTDTTPPNMAEALALLQLSLPEIKKTERGNFGKYAGLASVSRDLLPALAKVGLSFTARPTMSGDRFVLAYRLLHVSGDHLDGEYPLPAGVTPQAMGSAITYGRRYCLCAITGAVGEDDDDGQAASQESKPRASRARQAPKPEPGPTQDDPNLISPEQRKAIMAGFGQLGITDREARMHVTRRLADAPDLASTSDLTRAQARAVLDGIARKRAEQQEVRTDGE